VKPPIRRQYGRQFSVWRSDFRRNAGSIIRSPYTILFLLLIFVFAYTPPRWQDWNQNSRFNLTRSIVEQQTVRIDDYVANTGDYAEIEGRIYTDKAPGLSLMAVPVYAVTEALQPYGLSAVSERLGGNESFTATLNQDGDGLTADRVDVAVALYIATVVTVAMPAALMLVLLSMMVWRQTGCRTASILSVLIIGLATPVFAYSQAFYGHIPAAVCLIAALALLTLRGDQELSTIRLLGVGALLAWAVVIEIPAAVAALPIAGWTVWLAGRRGVLYGVAGAVPALTILAIYDLIAFGTVTPVGYQHSALWQEQHSVGFLSLTYPHWDAISGLLWSQFRGILFYSPVLLLVIPGAVFALRDRGQRPVAIVALASFALFFLFIASSVMWWGGFSVGPRYLAPAMPMLALPLGAAIARFNGSQARYRVMGLGVTLLLATISGLLIWMTTFAGQVYPTDATRQPLADYVWPHLRDGDVARNLGMVVNLQGVLSLIPLAFLIIIAVGAIGLSLNAGRNVVFTETGDPGYQAMPMVPSDELVTELSSTRAIASRSGPDTQM
jgi:hypothetical protein